MHPAYSVILFTTASGAGYGLLALLGLVGISHGEASSLAFGLTAMVIALGLITVGLLSSTFHLGHPERAWRAFSQWRSSWLSREGVAAVLTYVPALLFGLVWSGLVEAPASHRAARRRHGGHGAGHRLLHRQDLFDAGHHPRLEQPRSPSRSTSPSRWRPAPRCSPPSPRSSAISRPSSSISPAPGWSLAIAVKLAYWRAIDSAPRDRTIETGHRPRRASAASASGRCRIPPRTTCRRRWAMRWPASMPRSSAASSSCCSPWPCC